MRRLLAGLLGALTLLACSGDDAPTAAERGDALSTVPSIATTTSTTEKPLTGDPLQVAEQGVSSFPDPYDPNSTLGGYGVILLNPNDQVMATGVHVTTRILDPSGAELLVDKVLLNAVMPGQRMALGRTLIEPVEEPTELEVSVVVTAWLTPAFDEGRLVAVDVITEPEANGGSVTRFTVRSSWPEVEDGVDATAIYRAADGRILAAESATLASVPSGVDTPSQIRLLAPIPDLATTEVFVGRGIAAQTTG